MILKRFLASWLNNDGSKIVLSFGLETFLPTTTDIIFFRFTPTSNAFGWLQGKWNGGYLKYSVLFFAHEYQVYIYPLEQICVGLLNFEIIIHDVLVPVKFVMICLQFSPQGQVF